MDGARGGRGRGGGHGRGRGGRGGKKATYNAGGSGGAVKRESLFLNFEIVLLHVAC